MTPVTPGGPDGPGKKPTLRRFIWCRIHHAVIDDVRWRLVSRMSGAPLHLVEAFMVRLELFASAARPRGSVEDFNIAALAAHWNLPNDETLGRIYAALEHESVGWIDQDRIVTFWDRNPDTEDATAAERMRRMRARRKRAKDAAVAGSGSVTRNSRNVTTISDQILEKEADSATSKSGEAVPSLSNVHAGDAEAWLDGEGLRIVAERLQTNAGLAETRLARWRAELAGDAAALADVIRAAEAADYVGGRCHNLIVDEIRRRRMLAHGPGLPLPPVVAARRTGGEGGG